MGTYDYTYDADGNRIAETDIATGAVTTYQWNNANELIGVQRPRRRCHVRLRCLRAKGLADGKRDNQNFIYDGQSVALVLNSSGQVIERDLYGPAVDRILAADYPVPTGPGPRRHDRHGGLDAYR